MAKGTKRGKKAPPRARRRAAAPAAGAGERFELAMRAINEGVYDWDVASGKIDYSEGVYSVLRMPRSVKTPVDWRRRIHPDDLAAYDAAILAHFRKKTARFECDYRYRARDRSWRWARQHGIAQRDARGRAVRMIGSIGDISDLKRAEEARRESDERYAFAMRSINEGVYDWNIAEGRTYYSERVVNAVGLTPKQLRTAADWHRRIHPEDRPRFDAALAAHFKGDTERFECDYRYRARDGSWRWARQHGIAQRDARGRAVRMIGSTGDINELKLGEIALRRAHDEATEALEQQTATAEILRAISSSPNDIRPILDTLVSAAARFCGATDVAIMQLDGGVLRGGAACGKFAEVLARRLGSVQALEIPATRASVSGRAVADRRVIHVHDLAAEPEGEYPAGRDLQRRLGHRTMVAAPLLREGVPLGAIALFRAEVKPFSEKQLSLLQVFADQAVIAIENVRLFNETKEALERQTATAEVLASISGSMTDTQPVFERIVKNVRRLFGTRFAVLQLLRGDMVEMPAIDGDPAYPGFEKLRDRYPRPLDETTVGGRAMLSKQAFQLAPVIDNPATPAATVQFARDFGFNSVIFSPMIHEGKVIGAIGAAHPEAKPFDDRQIELIKTFADQAVVAIQNARLFNETREALEHQKASADILRVISSSPTDLAPVMAALAESAARLCEATDAHLWQREGDELQVVASHGGRPISRPRLRIGRDSVAGRAAHDCKVVHVHDLAAAYEKEFPDSKAMMQGGYRSILAVPLVREGSSIGVILIRRTEVRPFTPKQLALLQTFADQAVIAIENVRLFNETKESLERQTAISDILRVISNSPSDVKPVLDAVAERAARICEARVVDIILREGETMRVAATYGDLGRPLGEAVPLDRTTVMGRSIIDRLPVHVADLQNAGDEFPRGQELALRYGHRTILAVPLLREGHALGTILVRRADTEVRPFEDKHIALLKTFADQAAIAIENVRLFDETKEALERQTATAGILAAMSGSMTDAKPVFEAIVRSCSSLFPGSGVTLRLLKEGNLQVEANVGMDAGPVPVDRTSGVGKCVLDSRTVHLPDLEAAVAEFPRIRQLGLKYGYHSGIYAPLLREGVAIGTIAVLRPEIGGFSEKDVALFNTFADQAVIAIENVRLFNETKEALERQTATAEILKVISSSPTDTQPTFEAIVGSCQRLFGGRAVTLVLPNGDLLQSAAFADDGTALDNKSGFLQPWPFDKDSAAGTCILESRVVSVPDTEECADQYPRMKELALALGYRAVLCVPLLRDGTAIGAIGILRTAPGEFVEKEIALSRTFADQAVIAIENVRLFNETKEALQRQTATAEILKVIASSPSDVQPVFDAIARSAYRLIGGFSTAVARVFDDVLHLVAFSSTDESGNEALKNAFPMPVSRSKAARTAAPVCISDTEALPDSAAALREVARARGFRSIVIVPLLREGVATGTISVTRRDPGEFSDHQVDLLKTFADQAVIAIENVRLFNETKEALERQTATAEILKVIASSPSDVRPVFDAILRSAVNLCGAEIAAVFPYDGKLVHLGATHNWPEEALQYFSKIYPAPPDLSLMSGRTILARSVVKLADAAADGHYDPNSAASGHWRHMLGVPMMREGQVLGALVVCWREPGETPQRQVDLLQTFADQAVIAIENVRLFNETREALERQTATAEILKVISSSPTDIAPVFRVVLEKATQLSGAQLAGLWMREGGDAFRAMNLSHGARPEFVEWVTQGLHHFGAPFFRPEGPWRAGQIPDIRETEPYRRGDSIWVKSVDLEGLRTLLLVPLLRANRMIGAIAIYRREVRPFTDKQVELAQSFADQAVIAIENVRLFNETKEALERQTASAEILKVISSSPTDVQPVFETIARNAVVICKGMGANVFRYDGELLSYAAGYNTSGEQAELIAQKYPMRPDRSQVSGRAIVSKSVVRVEDALSDRDYDQRFAIEVGWRRYLGVPMLREGNPIGAIVVRWNDPGPIPLVHEELVKTFADQAVIAIENVRLFNETKEALERQTATAEILKVISSSPTDVQPVFDAIVQSAARLFDCNSGIMMREGMNLYLRAAAGPDVTQDRIEAMMKLYPIPFDPEQNISSRTIADRKIIEVPDTEAAGIPAVMTSVARVGNFRSITIAPLLREGVGIGVISLTQVAPGLKLNEKQLALLQTFADQAVIAIENVRLFKELEMRTEALTRSVGQLTALGEVGQAISSTLDVETVLKTIVSRAVQLTGLDGGSIYEYDERVEEFHLRATENADEEYLAVLRSTPIRKGEGAVGRAALTGEPTQIPDIREKSYQTRLRDALIRAGYRAVLVVPLRREEHVIGALSVTRKTPGPFAPEVVELLKTFATQSAMAIQNARLFREIAEKSKQLELASQHKSNFLASMSHELRTPLNAILGFNEMILGQVYGEVPADMQEPLADVQTSGKHLLRLINNVLDLAKIEAGRMELSLQDYSVHDTVESVRSTLRPLAAEKGLEFLASVPNDIPLAYGDSGRITQCLMNLAGNSLKFTKAGKVEISVETRDQLLVYKVADTGIGIPPDKIASLFTEFKQTDATIASEYGGTGLGLSISKKFVEMHGGRIWIESELGKGSTFIIEIPLRVSEGKTA